MSLIVKVHSRQGKSIVAVCDKDILGKLIEDGDTQLDLSSSFYQGEELDVGTVGDLIRNADHVNLVGEEAVKLALDEGVIDQSHVLKIKGIPFAQAVLAST